MGKKVSLDIVKMPVSCGKRFLLLIRENLNDWIKEIVFRAATEKAIADVFLKKSLYAIKYRRYWSLTEIQRIED